MIDIDDDGGGDAGGSNDVNDERTSYHINIRLGENPVVLKSINSLLQLARSAVFTSRKAEHFLFTKVTKTKSWGKTTH